ncbi:hypothetical protein PM082_001908 [Marasmius tenuissimus]|nr:hypothetical protein PM082_001908 [Marasmius tenuissimus]
MFPSHHNPNLRDILLISNQSTTGASATTSEAIPTLNEAQSTRRTEADWQPIRTSSASKTNAAMCPYTNQHWVFTLKGLHDRVGDFSAWIPQNTDTHRHSALSKTPIGRTIRNLNSTTGVVPGAMRTLIDTTRICTSCMYHFSAAAFFTHIEEGRCTSSQTEIYQDPHVDARLTALLWKDPSEIPRQDTISTTIGTMFTAWNSPVGLPLDLWEFLKTSVHYCDDCFLIRTFEADRLHRMGDRCAFQTAFED